MLEKFQCPTELKTKMESYAQIPEEELKGSLWDDKNDEDLKRLKYAIKKFYLEQQEYRCAYCRQQNYVEHHMAWDTEHIIPKNKYPGFMFEAENLCIACKDCNKEKLEKNVLKDPNRKKFPNKSEDYIIAHPHFDDMEAHIKLMPNSLFFLPRTEKGRKTVEICGLLRFVYRYADYGIASTDLKKHLHHLSDLLQITSDPAEEVYLISQIDNCTAEIRAAALADAKKKYLEKNANAANQNQVVDIAN